MLNKEKIIAKVIEKLNFEKIYQSKEIQNLIKQGMKKYPQYNTSTKDAKKVVKYIFENIKLAHRTKALSDKIFSGIT